MGTFKQYSCKKCKKKYELGGPQEFKKTLLGRRKEVRHPPPANAKISGLWLFLWCPKCMNVDKKILVEFVKPANPIQVWGHTAPVKPEYRPEKKGQFDCEKCKTYRVDIIEEGSKCSCGGKIEYSGTITT